MCRRPLLNPLPEDSEEPHRPDVDNQLADDQQTHTADEVLQELLGALEMDNPNGDSVPGHIDLLRRLVETLQSNNAGFEIHSPDTHGHDDYPDRSEFEMYS